MHQPVGEATGLKASEDVSSCIEPSREAVQELWRDSEVLHVDESGLRVQGKRHWLPVASTDRLTHDDVQAKRGQEAMDEAGILDHCTGTAVHDHWKPYFPYDDGRHALCNAHHLRELPYLDTPYQQPWANDMSERLLEIKAAVEETLPRSASWPPGWLEAFARRYDAMVQEGCDANPLAPLPAEEEKAHTRGRRKHTPPRNLLRRLRDFTVQVLAFMNDLRVPFDNNQAERDVRMVQVKQKVSGGFRTLEGTKRFGRICGYISTARTHAKNIFEAIRDAFDGTPFIPSPEMQ